LEQTAGKAGNFGFGLVLECSSKATSSTAHEAEQTHDAYNAFDGMPH